MALQLTRVRRKGVYQARPRKRRRLSAQRATRTNGTLLRGKPNSKAGTGGAAQSFGVYVWRTLAEAMGCAMLRVWGFFGG